MSDKKNPHVGEDHGSVPSGWQVVPQEPTREMWAAMGNALVGYRNRHHDKVAGELWEGVLAAAPTAPPPGDGRVEELVEAARKVISHGKFNDPTDRARLSRAITAFDTAGRG